MHAGSGKGQATSTGVESVRADGWNPEHPSAGVVDANAMQRPATAPLESVMELAVTPACWEAALVAVERNRGAPGPDGMRTQALRAHLDRYGAAIRRKLLAGTFLPAAARRVEIAKPGGGVRGLNIPNVLDRFVQQLLLQVLSAHLDPQMHPSSFGFRPGRSAHDAVRQAQAYAREGYTWVVDMDIEKFFDRVNHDVLMHRLSREVRDKRCLKLIGRMLRAGHILPDGEVVLAEQGTPQGGPLSPLLANLYLDALDWELSRRGLRFCRYADDCNIYLRSERSAQRVLEGIRRWVAAHLRLTVHPDKSGVGPVWTRKFLGFTLTLTLALAVAGSSIGRLQERVRSHFSAQQSVTTVALRDSWLTYVRGWWGYFGIAEDLRTVQGTAGWMRRHMRKCFWQRWHNARGRCRRLRALGVPPRLQRVGHSSRGAWRMARSEAMHRALSNATLRRYGFLVPTDLGTCPDSNRRMRKTARPVVWEAR